MESFSPRSVRPQLSKDLTGLQMPEAGNTWYRFTDYRRGKGLQWPVFIVPGILLSLFVKMRQALGKAFLSDVSTRLWVLKADAGKIFALFVAFVRRTTAALCSRLAREFLRSHEELLARGNIDPYFGLRT
jgi:hypothetical protein